MRDDLDALRRRMDSVTTEMMLLLLDRMEIAKKIGHIKREAGRDVTDEEREEQLRRNVLRLCRERVQKYDGSDAGVDGNGRQPHPATAEQVAARFLNFLLNESNRIQSAPTAGPTHLSVFQRAKRLERSGRRIIHMEVGEPDFMPPEEVKHALAGSYDAGHVRYGEPRGMPELLDALAARASAKFGSEVLPGHIMVSPGGRFAIFAAMSALLRPGDEVVIMEPAWPAYRNCAMRAGAKVRAVRTCLEDSWTPSTSSMREMINPSTRMIILNYPNNPTGRVLPLHVMDEVMEMASEGGLYVLADEIYSEYTKKPWRSVISYHYDRGISVQSFSKSHAMTGLRIGYAIANSRPIIDRMASLSALCLTSVSAPIQYAALRALDADTSQNATAMSERLGILERTARGMGLEFVPPDGGMYIFARMRGTDGASFVERMLEGKGVALAPGTGFGGAYRDFIRISACLDTESLTEGMNRLKSMLNEG